MNQQEIMYIGKPQILRLWDVFFLAPIMVYTGLRKSSLPGSLRFVMVTSGILTAIYNGRNYLIQRKIMQQYNEAPGPGIPEKVTRFEE
jgi:hypothetical protein